MNHTTKLAAVLGTAALAIPAGAIASASLTADGGTTEQPAQQVQPVQDPYAPAQDERPEGAGPGRDCPEEGGESQGGESGAGEQTAL
jgi:hypothetical protein